MLLRRCGAGARRGIVDPGRVVLKGEIGSVSMEKKGLGNWLMAILAREGTVCHSLQEWMRGWMWKGRGLGREGTDCD